MQRGFALGAKHGRLPGVIRMKNVYSLIGVLLLATGSLVCAQNSGETPIKVTTTIHPDGTRTVLRTDPDQHTSESTTYGPKDKVLQRVVYALDDQNQPVTGSAYSLDGKVISKVVFKRNASNQVSEQSEYTPDDRLMRRLVYEYGSGGRVTKIRAYDAQGNELQPASAAKKDTKKQPPRRH